MLFINYLGGLSVFKVGAGDPPETGPGLGTTAVAYSFYPALSC